ncbi:Cytochrome P450-like protein 79 [Elsinoe fawcettii]|nr:Cytochrome P450-like protein 79 [Elsinoe fawcettii]
MSQGAKQNALDIPKSDVCFEVSIIDTTTNIVSYAPGMIEPMIEGHEYLHLPTYAYLLKHPSGRNLVYDLGGRRDWRNLSPTTVKALETAITAFDVKSNTGEILEAGGVDLSTISSVILSHWHWDHVGDPAIFPKTTSLVVGPGFKKSFMPGYPTNPEANLLDADFEGREVQEIEFGPSLEIGGFAAYDLYGDGSIFILDTAGHTVGHISALVRTTPDTFLLLGGDICHHGGAIRPTPAVQMPDPVPGDVPLLAYPDGCPCSIFTACHPQPDQARTKPYFEISRDKGSWFEDPEAGQACVNRLQAFDADENVFVAIAHDEGLGRVCDLFPNGTMSDWKQKGWKKRAIWGFLNALPADGHTIRGKTWAL